MLRRNFASKNPRTMARLGRYLATSRVRRQPTTSAITATAVCSIACAAFTPWKRTDARTHERRQICRRRSTHASRRHVDDRRKDCRWLVDSLGWCLAIRSGTAEQLDKYVDLRAAEVHDYFDQL